MRATRFAAVLILLTVVTTAAADTVDEILKLAGTDQGLCLHLTSGRETSPALTAELAARSRMLVHGLALDEADRVRALKAIESRKLFGQASVEKLTGAKLPYLRDLARLVVIEEEKLLEARGVALTEILRVTAPGGAVCMRRDGAWTRLVKPRPEMMDEWRHPWHDPGRTWVSADKVIRYPLGLRWTDGLPNNLTGFSDCKGYVVAGGRIFTLGINQVENLGQRRGKRGYDQWLCARDAFSGIPLWKLNCKNVRDGKDITWTNTAPLIADDDSVYCVYEENKLIRVDAADGRILWTREVKSPMYRLVLLDGVLVSANWSETESIWFKTQPKIAAGSVEAFDAETGKPLWQLRETAWTLVAADDTVYLQPRGGGKPRVIAVDVKTGKERWRVETDKGSYGLNSAGAGVVTVSHILDKKNATLFGYDPKTGKELWKTTTRARSVWTPIVDGLVWNGGVKLEPRTGKSQGKVGHWIGGQGCSPRTIVFPYVINGRSASALELPQKPGETARSLYYRGARGGCVQGMVPANGMLYTGQNICKCLPSHVYGFLALGPTTEPTDAEFTAKRTVEKGPAFGSPGALVGEQDWPTLRADAARSASSTTTLPTTFEKKWSVEVVSSVDGPLADAWKPQLLSPVSAPVVAGGLVVVTATDLGRIHAFDAATGDARWAVTLPSRVDGPPTIANGLAVVGCHDGRVYALRATDGVLAWRTRVAPTERRMVAWGRVESVWPATASVLVHEDVAYATAGRSTETDGGIAVIALDVNTGETRWARSIGAGVLRLNDVFAMRDDRLVWRYLTLDKVTGKTLSPASPADIKSYGGGKGNLEGAIIDGTYTISRNRRAGRVFRLGKSRYDLLAWRADLVLCPKAALKPDGETQLWRAPRLRPLKALVMTKNLAVYASNRSLYLLSLNDGKRLGSIPLDAPPTYDGLAVADGRLYVSLRSGKLLCFGKTD